MDAPKPNGEGRAYALQLNRKMLGKLIVIAVLMFGFGYGLVPVYKSICSLTGVNFLTPQDSTVVAPTNTQIDKSRTITVEFDGNARGPWRFRPAVSSMQVHPGEMTQVIYEVVNKEARTMDAQAIPSYAPMQAEAFFKKVECFCFTQQTLGPNQAKEFPVVFYIDPKLPKDVKSIMLSYTFFEISKPVVAKPA
ncbi:cytochrome c oxidase assembly protein [Glaciimonas sp. CA11.2]|uniref:cytochrome c oxidase assembly protein n=1 Tax=unclassified Glaciimonas TaxID=2644401 RepID=UPI002AB490E1|nr:MULTISPECIES: cytochrome c oxidase assembly protein [unclassified Glaciimonas]MDY7546630.1 cytochrome c oxidase assembly protein [Glaciimonas sp. CA11.2]MEB0011755.1 cytochrome c oxidase assembly protein [Glaciimonas sp. Cout2]MEB0080689.1 cytochrome c oxidase assembly protein [Glaciimonas sp. Gout2]MEB0162185.1 cytochrome c oxidase assembly protein [Glaciimonas sp. CA11.2]